MRPCYWLFLSILSSTKMASAFVVVPSHLTQQPHQLQSQRQERITSFPRPAMESMGETPMILLLDSISLEESTSQPFQFFGPLLLAVDHGTGGESETSVSSTFLSLSSAFSPALGSSCIMLTIVALLYLWEESVKFLRESLPTALLPVVESILAEMGGLGFIGLLLQGCLGTFRETLGDISLQIFGEEEILIESFEYLHTAFFQVGIGFFVAAGAMVALGIQKSKQIANLEALQADRQTGACTVTARDLARYLPEQCWENVDDNGDFNSAKNTQQQPPLTMIWNDIFMSIEERAANALLLRERFMDKFDLPDTFRSERYISATFAENLLEFVELSPLTWIYLIPALSLANSVDLSHDVVNAASANAGESAGFFFSTPWAIVPSTVVELLTLTWGVWNCWKMSQIKSMVIPRLGFNNNNNQTTTEEPQILPPRIDNPSALESFSSSPAWVQPIESLWGERPQCKYDQLFGSAGHAGPELYRNSIKFQVWLCITQIVFWGTQIVPRDIVALTTTGGLVGDPSHLVAEFLTYGGFVLLSLAQLIFIAPTTFWNFCIVTSVEDRTSKKLLQESLAT